MVSRRNFLYQSTILTLSGLALTRCKMATLAPSKKIGVQLYTVRDAMAKDAVGTLKAIAGIGYNDVEGAGYREGKFYGMSPKEFKSTLNGLGLDMRCGHVSTGAEDKSLKRTLIGGDWEGACSDFANVGQTHIVMPYLQDFERKGIDDYKRLIDLLNTSGEVASKYGLKFGYHNHDFEFKMLDGELPYDLLLKGTDPKYVNFELDLYWIKFAGKDPFDYFEKHPGRFMLWHVKDMDARDKYFSEVGNGVIDWKPIFDKSKQSGMELFYVEQDTCRNHQPLDSIKISHDYLKKLKV